MPEAHSRTSTSRVAARDDRGFAEPGLAARDGGCALGGDAEGGVGRLAMTPPSVFLSQLRSALRRSALQARERGATREDRGVAELFLDAQKLIVLRDALAASRRTSFDLTGVRRDHEVGDRRVLGLT